MRASARACAGMELPPQMVGWTVVCAGEVTLDDGSHVADGIVLQDPTTGARFVLWWRKDPRREWELIPIGGAD